MTYSSQINTLFSGISDTSSDPPHNALAVGPNNVVMAEGSRVEWTDLSGGGGASSFQSIYQFYGSLPASARNSLFDPRAAYDSVNQRYVVTADNIGSNGTISNIDIAVSKDSNPNDGWYFYSLNTSLTINSQLTAADQPTVSLDGTNIYITAPQYNVNVSGFAGTEQWVIGDTAGAGGGIYNGGTMTVVANQVAAPGQGIARVVAGNNGQTYYASAVNTGSQTLVTVQTYTLATNSFGPAATLSLGNVDQGGGGADFTAQQQGTSVLLDAGDGRIQNLAYANGFLYGVSEVLPVGSSTPQVHWFKIDVSNPNSPTLVAQGNVSGAAIGSGVATFDGSIAVDGAGDVIINFTASGPNMYPADYYVYMGATDPSASFSAPVLYQASASYLANGDGGNVQRWGINSTAIADPNDPHSFWLSSEYVANGWWQTSVAQIAIQTPNIAKTNEDTPVGGSLASLAAAGSVFTAGNFTSSDGAKVTIAADGSFTYDPKGVAAFESLKIGQTAVDRFSYTVTDGGGNVTTAIMMVDVGVVDSGPVVANFRSSAHTQTSFSGITDPNDYPPDNAFAVGPNNIVMAEGARVEWTDLSGGGGASSFQSIYQFYGSLPASARNSLFDPRAAYDSVNQRYVVTADNIGSNGTISNIDIAVSKDSNPNDGWYFYSLNTSLTINSQLTAADQPNVSLDGTNIYITAPQYNVNVSGFAGTEQWVIGDTAGAGGGIYNGGTMTVVANQLASPGQGIARVVAGNNGQTYYASAVNTGSQTLVTVQTYTLATNSFGPAATLSLGNVDQGGGGANFTAQQQGTSFLLDAGDGRIQNLAYANGFLYGVSEVKPAGSSTPQVHWFKIDVSNPNSPTLVAQGNVSGAAIGNGVATFDGSIAVDGAGDVIINFTASGPNMYPADYYVSLGATDPAGSFSAPVLYRASTGYFNTGNGSSVQRWGNNSTAIADPNNPHSFWLSGEYVANGWWQTSVAQVAIQTPIATSTSIDTPVTGSLTSLASLADQSDTGDSLSFTAGTFTSSDGAKVTIAANGSYTYDPTGVTVIDSLPAGQSALDGFTYTATDNHGASATGVVTVSVTVPTVTERLLNDTGASSSDKITSNATLAGTGSANAVVHFTVDGTAISSTATANSTGAWQFTPVGLADGQHTIVASETDARGNLRSASLTFSLDTTPPAVTMTNAGGAASQAALTVTGTVSDPDVFGPGATVAIFDGTTQVGTAPVQANGSWSTNITLTNGTNTLTARDTDSAGNVGASAPVTYTYQAVPQGSPDHVVIVVEENHGYSDIIGNSAAPYINSLASQGTLFTNYYAVAHPSEPNYFAMFSGSTQGITADGPFFFPTTPTLAGELSQAGDSFVGYAESPPDQDHNPWASFGDSQNTGQDFSNFPTDFSKLPTVSFVIPNITDDMHTGTIAQGDQWLSTNLSAYANWATTHNSILVLTFDENDGTGNNQVATIVLGAGVGAGQNSQLFDHYSLLHTIENMYHLPALGSTATAPIMTFAPESGSPTVTSITTSGTGITSGNGDINAGKTVTLTVNFSAAVSVSAGGSPRLLLNDGGMATYSGGSGTTALSFSYTVLSGQNTADLTVSSLDLNGSTITNGSGNSADLSGATNYNPAGILQVDTTVPTIASILTSGTGITSGNGDINAGKTVTLTVNFSAAVSVSAGGTPRLLLNDGGMATYSGGSGTTALSFSYTVLAGQNTADLTVSSLDLNGSTITNGSGNSADLSSATNYNPAGILQVDTTVPTIASILTSGTGITSGNGDINAGKTVTLTVNFSAAVSVSAGGTPRLLLNDGGMATYSGGSGTTALSFSYTVLAGQNTADLTVSSLDLNGSTITNGSGNSADLSGATNYNPAGILQIDTTVPTIASILTSGTGITNGNGDLNAGKTVTLTVNFSAAVSVSAGGSPRLLLNDGGMATYSGGSGTTALSFSYTVLAGQNTADLTVSSLDLNGSTITNGSGNSADLSGATNYNPAGILQIDATVPTIAINTIAGNNNVNALEALTGFAIRGTATNAENGQIVTVNIINGQNTVVDSYTTSDQNNAWSVNVTSAQALALIDGVYTVTAEVADKAGNLAPLATKSLTVEEDNKSEAPILTIANTALTVQAGGAVALGITATPIDSDDSVTVKIAGLPSYEKITAPSGYNVSKALQSNGTYTWTISETSSTRGKPLTGLTLTSSYTGTGHPIATLTVLASNKTSGEAASSPSQTMTVTDPPAITTSPTSNLIALFNQYAAWGFHGGRADAGEIAPTSHLQSGHDVLAFLATPGHLER